MTATATELDWRGAWAAAQRLWGVRLHDPVLVAQPSPPSFAWFSFPPEITIDVAALHAAGAEAELESVFAHEIGHHVLSPSTRLDALKLRHQLARALAAGDRPRHPEVLAMLANLWSDQLINVRVADLQRRRDPGAEPGMVRLWRRLTAGSSGGALDWVLRRAYELTWALPPGTLCSADPPRLTPSAAAPATAPAAGDHDLPDRYAEQERRLQAARAEVQAAERAIDLGVAANPVADAHLLARLVRVFADDPISGGLGFGMLAAAYLRRTGELEGGGLGCAGEAGAAGPTAAEIGAILGDPRLATTPVHPSADPALGAHTDAAKPAGGQGYGLAETLALYDPSLAPAVMAAWYRIAARRWVKPLTERRPDLAGADLPGPLEVWELGDDLADLDWPGTLTTAPTLLPGLTTRRRGWLDDPDRPAEVSLQLDLYIDSSGSMPDPARGSAAVLAGAILALSVLRGGGAVRPTSWASAGQVAGPDRFLRDPVEVMAGIAHFFRGGTSFPLDLLAARYRDLPAASETVRRHLVVLSDDGLESMFGVGNPGFETVAAAVRPKLSTATLVLLDRRRVVAPLAAAAGYDVAYLETMDDAPAVCARLAEVIRG